MKLTHGGIKMNKTISLDQFPRKVGSLLKTAWEGDESIVLEHSGVAVAAVVPIDEYRKWHPESKTTEDEPEPETGLSYELPEELLLAYHRLADKKFDSGLTPDEEAELARLDQQLDDGDPSLHSG
jgi:antitoxin (DNA-binding transcriptional repressor) of toxin-antitoxin stability system